MKNTTRLWAVGLAGLLAAPLQAARKTKEPPKEERARPAGKSLIKSESGPKAEVTAKGSAEALPEDVGLKKGDDEESMDVTITGEARDEIPVVLDPPPLDLPFKDIAGLSRDGQTDRVLNGPMEHIGGGELLSFALLAPRQVMGSLPVNIPTPPFIQMELAPGMEASHWDFRVLDEANQMIFRVEGDQIPKDLIVWDGQDKGMMKIRTGQVYTPLLILTGKSGKIDRFYGEPVLFDVMQYTQGDIRRTEFLNESLFGTGSADIFPEMAPPFKSLLSQMRRTVGTVYHVTVYYTPNELPLARARLKTLQSLLEQALMLDSTSFVFEAAPAVERGDISEIVFSAKQ